MGKRKKPQTGLGTPVVIENEGGLDVVRSDEGKEIRYTKDYGLGACPREEQSVGIRVSQVFWYGLELG